MKQDLEDLLEIWPMGREFDLPPHATVLVAGAYQGKVLELMANLYPDYGSITGFEPQCWAAAIAQERTKEYNIQVYPFALGTIEFTGLYPMGEWNTDACSFVNMEREQGQGLILPYDDAMDAAGCYTVDLAIINMEGYEFKLINYLLNTEKISRYKKLAVQWHIDIGAGSEKDADGLILALEHEGLKLQNDQRYAWTYHTRT